MKLKVGDLCTGKDKEDIYLVLNTDALKPITVRLIDTSNTKRLNSVGGTYTNRDNKWKLYRIGFMSPLEAIIYGVYFENP